MKYYTDIYNQARLAGAKPLIHCYIKSDFAWRCFGKEYPNVSHLRSDVNVYEWQARVLSFGDYRISLASESDNVFLALTSQQMNSCTISLDNADRFFTLLLEMETLLFGELQLYQGFAYPGFTFSDFLPLFSGQITKVELMTTTCQLTADIVVNPETASEPSIDTTTTYSLSVDLDTETAASEEFDYTDLSDLYTAGTFDISIELDRTGEDVAEILFEIENQDQGNNRIEIGVDVDNHLYLTTCYDVEDASPVYQTITSDFAIGTSVTKVTVSVDADGLVTLEDNQGNSTDEYVWYVDNTCNVFASYSSIVTNTEKDTSNNIYIAEYSNNVVKKYDTDGTLLFTYNDASIDTPTWICLDGEAFLWVACHSATRKIIRLNASGGLVTSFNIAYLPGSIVATSTDTLIVIDQTNDNIKKYSFAGTLLSTFGGGVFTLGTDIAIDPSNNIYVLDKISNKIYYWNAITEVYLGEFIVGSGNLLGMTRTFGGDFLVLENGVLCRYNSVGTLQETYYVGISPTNGQIETVTDVTSKNLELTIIQDLNDDYYILTNGPLGLGGWNQDTTPTSTDIVNILPLNNNTAIASIAVTADDELVTLWTNIGDASAVDFVDIIGNLEIAIVDGEWTEEGTIEKYTEEADEEEALTIDTELIPDTADYYTASSEQNVFLPLVFGNMNENSDTGAWVAPCIDTVNYAYCVSGRSCMAGNISVYADGILQSGNYAYYENQNYLSMGKNIAVIIFSSDPGDAIITVKCMGHPNGVGTLMTNPIDIIEDLIDYAAELNGSTPWELDDVSFVRARQEVYNRGYLCAGVIQQSNTIGYWIKAILACFLMTPEFNSEGKLAIRFMSFENTEDIKETIEEYQAISLSASQKSENLCNRIIINYANSYTEIDKRYKTGGNLSYFRTLDETNETSKRKYGEHQHEFNFDWTRNDNSVLTVATILLNRYNNPLWTVNYIGQDFKFLPIDLLDQVEGEFSFFPGQTVTCELREKIINLDNFTSSLLLQVVNFEEIPEPELNYNIYIGNDRVYIGSDAVYFGV